MATINIGDAYWHFDREQVKRIEPEAKYVADLCVKNIHGGWSESPVAVFYTPTPSRDYKNNYFGIYKSIKDEKWSICDATSAANHEWSGLERDGEIIFSRWRHDFRSFKSGEPYVDGGADYTRIVGYSKDCKPVKLRLVDGDWQVSYVD